MTPDTGAMTMASPDRPSEEVAGVAWEGIVAGSIGAATISIWFLFLDMIHGQPLATPILLGSALLHRGASPPFLGGSPAPFEVVVFYTWVHGLVFCLLGGVAARLLALAEKRPDAGFGILLLFVILECGFIVAALLFAETVLHRIAWQSILVGNLLAVAAITGYLRHRHPHLRIAP